MKWLKERDELIAQTEAFVKSIAARRPAAAAAPVSIRSTSIQNPFDHVAGQISAGQISVSPAAATPPTAQVPAQPVAAPQVPTAQVVTAQVVARPVLSDPEPLPAPNAPPVEDLPSAQQAEQPDTSLQAEPPPIRAFARGEVRKEIESRVAAFKANQRRFQREREAYYDAVLTKARSTADGSLDGSRS